VHVIKVATRCKSETQFANIRDLKHFYPIVGAEDEVVREHLAKLGGGWDHSDTDQWGD